MALDLNLIHMCISLDNHIERRGSGGGGEWREGEERKGEERGGRKERGEDGGEGRRGGWEGRVGGEGNTKIFIDPSLVIHP